MESLWARLKIITSENDGHDPRRRALVRLTGRAQELFAENRLSQLTSRRRRRREKGTRRGGWDNRIKWAGIVYYVLGNEGMAE